MACVESRAPKGKSSGNRWMAGLAPGQPRGVPLWPASSSHPFFLPFPFCSFCWCCSFHSTSSISSLKIGRDVECLFFSSDFSPSCFLKCHCLLPFLSCHRNVFQNTTQYWIVSTFFLGQNYNLLKIAFPHSLPYVPNLPIESTSCWEARESSKPGLKSSSSV